MCDIPPDFPFYISRSEVGGGNGALEYLKGVFGTPSVGYDQVVFDVPLDCPDLLFYQCTRQKRMGGAILIYDPVGGIQSEVGSWDKHGGELDGDRQSTGSGGSLDDSMQLQFTELGLSTFAELPELQQRGPMQAPALSNHRSVLPPLAPLSAQRLGWLPFGLGSGVSASATRKGVYVIDLDSVLATVPLASNRQMHEGGLNGMLPRQRQHSFQESGSPLLETKRLFDMERGGSSTVQGQRRASVVDALAGDVIALLRPVLGARSGSITTTLAPRIADATTFLLQSEIVGQEAAQISSLAQEIHEVERFAPPYQPAPSYADALRLLLPQRPLAPQPNSGEDNLRTGTNTGQPTLTLFRGDPSPPSLENDANGSRQASQEGATFVFDRATGSLVLLRRPEGASTIDASSV
jgi:hypothetical protein